MPRQHRTMNHLQRRPVPSYPCQSPRGSERQPLLLPLFAHQLFLEQQTCIWEDSALVMVQQVTAGMRKGSAITTRKKLNKMYCAQEA
eukprot:m.98498 g.98498  ORF g.98498 m.98498 type:complete len:87 (-) comp14874_c0_seq6:715-975(-)